MIPYIDNILNATTMYKLVFSCLMAMALFAVIFGFAGGLPYSGWQLLFSALAFTVFCFFINYGFAKALGAPATNESAIISGFILFFIMNPAANLQDMLVIFLISLVAMASKYIIAINKKHIFNPAAFAAVVFGFTPYAAGWWVANLYMLPLVCIVGFLIVRKIRRFNLFIACVIGFLISYFFMNGLADVTDSLWQIAVSWPLLFFSTIMLTEPSTTPPKNNQQLAYGFGIGLLLGSPFQIVGTLYTTPEVILVMGNIASFLVSTKRKIKMQFEEKKELAKGYYEFIFNPGKPLHFQAGQYMEWSLPHAHQDFRGMRRYFTIASAPNESLVKIGVRFSEPSSSFKKQLQNFKKGDTIFAGQVAGDFVLPKNKNQKLVFVAGGIGVTPFASMIRDLVNQNQKTDIVLFYKNKTDDFAYQDLLKMAEEKIGLKTVYITQGNVDEVMIKKYASDFKDRMFYLSGPSAMVDDYKKVIKTLGIPRKNIKTDYFPGFA